MSYCLIFPGQGTQYSGMSRGLMLDTAVDPGLLTLMDAGPEEDLEQTVNAQPAVLSVSAALWESSGLKAPAVVMGHSLGEYTALIAAGCLKAGQAIELVKKRASFMDTSRPRGEGGMAAVIGLSAGEVEEVISSVGDLWIANLNGASQVVISGNTRSIEAAVPLLKAKGARRVVPLKVSIASHCPYMEDAREALVGHLSGLELESPACPVVSNVTARPETDPECIKALLADQLVRPVRFEESVRSVAGEGISHFIEIGPRSVLAQLVRRIVPGSKVEAITNDEH
ncbi:MAG: ACP S-malonyltransferase [Syntrophaceae bacterium]|nr:ACP S-malonyltransferase [Deltaproteobacteria bacterium]